MASTNNNAGTAGLGTATCALSGQSPILDPVVTPTGQICSKKLLLQKLIDTNGASPFADGLSLDESQLISIDLGNGSGSGSGNSNSINIHNLTPLPPKLTSANSIPAILNTLSTEYDSLVLELYDTRKALQETRQELSVALYQNDAAVRVIARVVLERDLARRQLADAVAGRSKVQETAVSVDADVDDDNDEAASKKRKRSSTEKDGVNIVEEEENANMADADANADATSTNSIPKAHADQLESKWKQLFSTRKAKTKPSAEYASFDSISDYTATKASKKYHKTSVKGIAMFNGVTGDDAKDDIILSNAASDKSLIWYNVQTTKVISKATTGRSTIKPNCMHTSLDGSVTALITNDNTLKVYTGMESETAHQMLLEGDNDPVGLVVHPTNQHIFVVRADGTIQIIAIIATTNPNADESEANDEKQIEIIATLDGFKQIETDHDGDIQCTSVGLHPDGLILALGRNDGSTSIWDLRSEKLAGLLEGKNKSASIATMTFSEKGYHVATASSDSTITIWDLRKQKIITTISLDEDGDGKPTALSFDPVGKYFAYGTDKGKIIVTIVKDWDKKTTFNHHDGAKKASEIGKVTGLVWGKDAKCLITSTDKDRGIKIWKA